MSELTTTDLRIAYSAVKMQRVRGDKEELWFDEEMRERFVKAEMKLESALRNETQTKENKLRGGPKPKFV